MAKDKKPAKEASETFHNIMKASVSGNPKPQNTTQYDRFQTNEKTSLKDFNEDEARGWTIDRLQQIEYRINEKILEFFKPENKELFKKIVLSSAVLDIGGKVKILRNIGVDPKTLDKIRKLTAIRNGFAHAAIGEFVTVHIITDKDGEEQNTHIKAHSTIAVMDSSGKLTTKNAREYLNEFFDLYRELKNEL
jgi:hypothetical protein